MLSFIREYLSSIFCVLGIILGLRTLEMNKTGKALFSWFSLDEEERLESKCKEKIISDIADCCEEN